MRRLEASELERFEFGSNVTQIIQSDRSSMGSLVSRSSIFKRWDLSNDISFSAYYRHERADHHPRDYIEIQRCGGPFWSVQHGQEIRD